MKKKFMKAKLVTPILTILVGAAWLLNTLNIIPGVDWLWTVGLAAVGIISIAVGGLNKLTVVIGPFLVVAAIFSIMRQTGKISLDHEVPILVIVLGILMLISQLSKLPTPESLKKPDNDDKV